MRALILPLNRYFYYYPRYTGKYALLSFIERYKMLSVIYFKAVGHVIVFIIAILLVLIILPIGIVKARSLRWKKIEKEIDDYPEKVETFGRLIIKKYFGEPSINLKDKLERIESCHLEIFIYYTSEMIPKNKRLQKRFYKKTEQIKNNLKINCLFEANTKEDLKLVLQNFNLDPAESIFVSNGKFELKEFKAVE